REMRPGCWISYVPLDAARADLRALARPALHEPLAFSEYPWEALKIGGGTPPVLTPHGWLTIHHGVSGEIQEGVAQQTKVFYSAGAMLLDRDDPRIVRYRSPEPILAPGTVDEREGLVNNVVFPTGADLRGNRLDVYYGMADSRIGVATMDLSSGGTKGDT
ncbi:MAG: glycosidase, partial [Chloroflexales bacterium]|nr:glycosidase [Chloroflexales bacterium]